MSLTDWESLRPSYIAAIQTQQSQFGHKRQSNLKPLDLSYGPKYSDTSLPPDHQKPLYIQLREHSSDRPMDTVLSLMSLTLEGL